MEGFDERPQPARRGPQFEPPVDPGEGPSRRGLALVARIVGGRGLAADAAGIPPLDSDQVLDLQRTAGNRLTSGALARWTDALPAGENVAQELLGQLLPARATDRGLYDTICAALDALEPQIHVQVSGPPGEVAIEASGPAGSTSFKAAVLAPATTLELPMKTAFGRATAIEPHHALEILVAGHRLTLPVPFDDVATAGGYTARAELR
jgi:hypothetical protein